MCRVGCAEQAVAPTEATTIVAQQGPCVADVEAQLSKVQVSYGTTARRSLFAHQPNCFNPSLAPSLGTISIRCGIFACHALTLAPTPVGYPASWQAANKKWQESAEALYEAAASTVLGSV